MRKRRRGLLRMYYGVDDQVPEQKANPMDIDHAQFRSDMFMEKVLKECSLNELYHMEGKMKKGMLAIPLSLSCFSMYFSITVRVPE